MVDKSYPKEIPSKKIPNEHQPEKAPKPITGAEPGKNNPRNPKEDKA